MNAMAANYSVYSNHLRGYEPLFSDNDIYVYCASGNVVVVCLDCCGSSEGQRYEENKHIAPIIFHNGDEPRPSMVWKLSKTLQLMRGRLKVYYADADVYGVLLTEANIVNADDMEDNWETIGIKVIDGFKRLKGRKMKVNNDCEMTEKAYFGTPKGKNWLLKAENGHGRILRATL